MQRTSLVEIEIAIPRTISRPASSTSITTTSTTSTTTTSVQPRHIEPPFSHQARPSSRGAQPQRRSRVEVGQHDTAAGRASAA